MRCTNLCRQVFGFSITKSKTKRRQDGSICHKYIVCSSQRHRENELSQKDITRTDCDARVQFSISKEGIWRVQKVVLDHNHYLASPNTALFDGGSIYSPMAGSRDFSCTFSLT